MALRKVKIRSDGSLSGFDIDGYFHEWTTTYYAEKYYPVALVEDDRGKIWEVLTNDIKFLDHPNKINVSLSLDGKHILQKADTIVKEARTQNQQ